MESEWSVTPIGGRGDVVLVRVALRNPSAVDRRVRVTNRLDGPVLPPKRAGVPEPGWDDDGFEGVVPAEGRRSLGYACPSPPKRPPVSVVEAGRAVDDEGEEGTPGVAVRELDDPRPPSDAVPGGHGTEDSERRATPGSNAAADGDGDAVPPEVESWLTAVEGRIERGEQLTDASVEAATTALDADGVAVPALEARLAEDAAALEAVAERAAALANRETAVDVPVDALRRLA